MESFEDVSQLDAAQLTTVDCNFNKKSNNIDCTLTNIQTRQMRKRQRTQTPNQEHTNDDSDDQYCQNSNKCYNDAEYDEEMSESDTFEIEDETSEADEEYLQSFDSSSTSSNDSSYKRNPKTECDIIKCRIERFFKNPIVGYKKPCGNVSLKSETKYKNFKKHREAHTVQDCFPEFRRSVNQYLEIFLNANFENSWKRLVEFQLKRQDIDVKYKNESNKEYNYRTIVLNGTRFYKEIVYYSEIVKFSECKFFEKLRLTSVDTLQMVAKPEQYDKVVKFQIISLKVDRIELDIIRQNNVNNYRVKIDYSKNKRVKIKHLLRVLENLFCDGYLTSEIKSQHRPITSKEFENNCK